MTPDKPTMPDRATDIALSNYLACLTPHRSERGDDARHREGKALVKLIDARITALQSQGDREGQDVLAAAKEIVAND